MGVLRRRRVASLNINRGVTESLRNGPPMEGHIDNASAATGCLVYKCGVIFALLWLLAATETSISLISRSDTISWASHLCIDPSDRPQPLCTRPGPAHYPGPNSAQSRAELRLLVLRSKQPTRLASYWGHTIAIKLESHQFQPIHSVSQFSLTQLCPSLLAVSLSRPAPHCSHTMTRCGWRLTCLS